MKNVFVEQSLEECLCEIKNSVAKQEVNLTNHIEHINKDISVINYNIGNLNSSFESIKTDVEWIKKIGFILFVSILGLLSGIILNII